MKRRDFLAALGHLPFLSLGACSPPAHPLRFASQVWPGYELIFLARSLGQLPETRVHLLEIPNAVDAVHALAANLADGAALTLDELIRARDSGLPLVIVAVFDVSSGADRLLAPAGMKLADLAGKRIGVEESTLGALMLARALRLAGLARERVQVVHLDANRHLEAWQRREVDALITYEPNAGMLERQGAVNLFDSRSLSGLAVDVMAFTPYALEHHAEDIRTLIAAHFAMLSHFRINPRDATHRMSARMHTPATQIPALFKGLYMPDLSGNRKLLDGDPPPLAKTARDLNDAMIDLGLIKNRVDLTNLVDPGFLPEHVPMREALA